MIGWTNLKHGFLSAASLGIGFLLAFGSIGSTAYAQFPASSSKDASSASGQDSEEWLTWIAKSGKVKKSSWLPSWKPPTPSLPWSKPKGPTSYSTNNKTTVQKMSQASKRWWNKTAELLDPYPEPKTKSVTSESGKSWFSWFGGAKEERRYNNVPDFLGGEMPK